MTLSNVRTEWAVYARTGGGYIATPDPKSKLRRFCWITAEGAGYYKEMGQPQILLGRFKDIKDVIDAARRLG